MFDGLMIERLWLRLKVSKDSLKEERGLLVDAVDVLDAVELEKAVSVHPFESSEGREDLAVVETSGAANEIVSRCAHHRRLNRDSLLVIAYIVLHIVPDPQRTLVERTKIVTSDILLTKLVIVCLGLFAEAFVSPLDRGIVDLSATIAFLVHFSEVSELLSSFLLDGLAGAELGLDLRSCNRIISGIKLVKEVILVL